MLFFGKSGDVWAKNPSDCHERRSLLCLSVRVKAVMLIFTSLLFYNRGNGLCSVLYYKLMYIWVHEYMFLFYFSMVWTYQMYILCLHSFSSWLLFSLKCERQIRAHVKTVSGFFCVFFCLFSVMPWLIYSTVILATTTFTWLPFC